MAGLIVTSNNICKCSLRGEGLIPAAVQKPDKTVLKLSFSKIEASRPKIAVNASKTDNGAVRVSTLETITVNNSPVKEKEKGSLIPVTKQMVDPFRQGRLIENGVAYRQTVVVRSYEVGPDKTTTIETFLNLFQETALNHVWMSGLLGDGMGATHGMISNDLIWVVSRMQVQIESYPMWGEIAEIDTWVGASGKNGMRRDWLIRSNSTGQIFARGTSTWVMMNKLTRRLSKMPDVVRGEVEPWFLTRRAISDESNEKIAKLDDNNADYIRSDLRPRRSDLDMNQHVNNVKYVGWMLETVPECVQEGNELAGITLEYRRECGRADIVQSLCQHVVHERESIESPTFPYLPSNDNKDNSPLMSLASGLLGVEPFQEFTHLLRLQGGEGRDANAEIVRASTQWRRKSHHHSS
ncbi:hypothetical protein SUGI_0636360 [Cryptomeria japonica]|uniref:palmitoyl-acyl carrier protein thioesterase, chloroplastic-like n=1 Tax=Cryptomeria japonica TaxID=3369 RepID=UPI002414AD42|nr:palmitoyl-acyl carrier protein thioesterase, chloroplastic-like [Cryptomeria japonica]GLJ31671.1 hypothetical protein SUGI_0636360 [Cryptomeria japonica]